MSVPLVASDKMQEHMEDAPTLLELDECGEESSVVTMLILRGPGTAKLNYIWN